MSYLESGERSIPGKVDPATWNQHLVRYYFSADFVRNKKILDVGCGCGDGAYYFAKLGAKQVIGIDNSKDAIEYAKSHFKHPGLNYHQMSVDSIKFVSEKFDVITCFETIEHVQDQQKSIEELKKILDKTGVLIISTPNQNEHPGEFFNKFHTHELNKNELSELLARCFKHVMIMSYSMMLGIAIYPTMYSFKELPMDNSLLDVTSMKEPPFFYVLCSDNENIVKNNSGKLFIHSFDRHQYSEYLLNQSVEIKKIAAREYLVSTIRHFINEKQYEAITPFLKKILEDNSQDAEYHYLYAFCLHLQNQNLELALLHYNQAQNLGFDEFWIRYNRGCLYVKLEKKDLARVDLEKAITLNHNFEEISKILNTIN